MDLSEIGSLNQTLETSEEEDEEIENVNDFEDIISELNLEIDPPKLPELLETSKYFNKNSA